MSALTRMAEGWMWRYIHGTDICGEQGPRRTALDALHEMRRDARWVAIQAGYGASYEAAITAWCTREIAAERERLAEEERWRQAHEAWRHETEVAR